MVAIALAVGFLVGTGFGWWIATPTYLLTGLLQATLDRSTSKNVEFQEDSGSSDASVDSGGQSQFLATLFDNLLLSAKVQSLESAIDQLEQNDVDPRLLARTAIDRMSERELRQIVGLTTQLGAEAIEEIDDIREFAERLIDIAMEGTVIDQPHEAGLSEVVFGVSEYEMEANGQAQTVLERQENRIYAFFPTDSYEGSAVMVKWYRVDEPEIVLFRRHSISPGDQRGFVWVEQKAGWQSGHYQVDIFSGDASMDRLAFGRYEVE